MKRFKVFNASAGSGKTYTLVIAYLTICLTKVFQYKLGFKHILAITFTKAAAKEMRDRAFVFLNTLSQGVSEDPKTQKLFKSFRESTGLSNDELQLRASKVLQEMLHNYGLIGFSTIDAFVTRLVKPFSESLGFAPNYEINLDIEEVLEVVIERILAQIPNDKNLQKTIDLWITNQVQHEEKTNNLTTRLIDFAKEVIEVKNTYFIRKLLQANGIKKSEAWLSTLNNRISILENEVSVAGKKFIAFIERNNITDDDLVGKTSNRLSNLIPQLQKNDLKGLKITATLSKKQDAENGVFQKKATHLHALEAEFRAVLGEFIECATSAQGEYMLIDELRANLVFFQLAARIENELNEYSKHHQVVLLEQINQRIEKVLENNPTPFIYERIGVRYRYFLIDEFQDTSVLQWHNMLPLVEEILSTKNGEVILVGDAKQAIYRWRGGEMAQIVNFPEIEPNPYPDKNIAVAQSLRNEHLNNPLQENYRSAKSIVNFTSQFLEANARFLPNTYAEYYRSGIQTGVQEDLGLLQCHFKTTPEGTAKEPLLQQQDAFILHSVKEALANGVLPHDINILVRGNKNITRISDLLQSHNIRCKSERNDSLLEAPQIKILITALDYFLMPDKEGFATLLISQLHQWNPKAFPFHELWERFFTVASKKTFLDQPQFEYFIQAELKLSNTPLYDWFSQVAMAFAIDPHDMLLQQFLTICLDRQRNTGSWAAQFRSYLTQQQDRLTVTGQASNAVTLRTVHKSKGLSLHTVIIPDLYFHKTQSDSIWIDTPDKALFKEDFPSMLLKITSSKKDYEMFSEIVDTEYFRQKLDNINLYYVAITRAEKNLILFSPNLSKKALKEGIDPYNATQILAQFIHQDYNPSDSEEWVSTEGAWTPSKKQIKDASISLPLPNFSAQLPLLSDHQTEEAMRGAALHFCYANYMPELDCETWIQQCISQNPTWYTLEPSELTAFYNQLKQWTIELWPNNVSDTWIEREFVFQEEIIRPDRVDVAPDLVLVTDLKTGKPEPEHEKQIKTYLRCVEAVTERTVKGALLYLDTNQVTLFHGS